MSKPARRDTAIAFAAAILYVGVFLWFYPPMYSTLDEDNYLTMAYVLKAGTIYYDKAGLPPTFTTTFIRGHTVAKHPPGNSILLIPFVVFGPKEVFLSGLIFHLVGWFLFYRTLLRIAVCRKEEAMFFSLLYLFFPSFVIQSRTILSDLPGEVLVLAGFYFYICKRYVPAGALWGMASLVRTTNFLVFAAFAAGLVLRGKDLRQSATGWLLLCLGFFPFGVAMALNNYYAFGGILHVPSTLIAGSSFGVEFVPRNLGFFLGSLLLIYPFMLFGPFLYRGPARTEMLTAIGAVLAFYSAYFYLQSWDNWMEQLVIANRHLLPILPFFLLCYPLLWERMRGRGAGLIPSHGGAVLGTLVVGALLLGNVVASVRHYRYQERLATYRDLTYQHTSATALVLGTIDVVKLLNPAWGFRERRLLMHFDDCLPIGGAVRDAWAASRDVYVVALRRPFKDPSDAIQRCVREVIGRYRSEMVYQEEVPWRFRIYKLVKG